MVFSIVSGPGTVNGNTLTITGIGTVVIAVDQAGNSSYAAAMQQQQSIVVNPAPLTATANNVFRVIGDSNPTLGYMITGFVNGDTTAVVSGSASLATTAKASSPVGGYPITFTAKNLAASNYTFTYVDGTLVVYGTSLPYAFWLSSNGTSAGSGGFILTVNGANFTPASLVLWDGAARATTYVNTTQLIAAISAADIAAGATNLVTVANFSPNPGTSAAQPLAVMSSTPVARISSSTVAPATDGSGNYVLTLIGTNFVPASIVQWNGMGLTPNTSYVSPWQMQATITGAEYAARPALITVNNPAGMSAPFEMQ